MLKNSALILYLRYEDAIHKLNMLQRKPTETPVVRTKRNCTNVPDMENYLSRIGITLSMLDSMSVIHVAGTKGKGTTSAMCESILRHHGYRTGFYSSPHLVAVRERIRLDGRAISKEKFTSYFYDVYNALEKSKANENDMPGYFAILTVMAFHVFLKEEVDVAIIEVGIGGALDSTNVLREVPVVGITSLGLDHIELLGDTLPQIAAAKAGIMKRGCVAYTVSQPCDAMEVLQRLADEVQCLLQVVPQYDAFSLPKEYNNLLQDDTKANKINATLAIQLAHAWLQYKTNHIIMDPIITEIPQETVIGLKEIRFPGRYQVVETDYATFYLDGAHTKESMELCAEWYKSCCRDQRNILIFSATGHRNINVLLGPLIDISFDMVYFVQPRAYNDTCIDNDNYSVKKQASSSVKHAQIWSELKEDKRNKTESSVTVLSCISDVLKCIESYDYKHQKQSVLITGSIHLVGSTLTILHSKYNLHVVE